MKSVQDRDSCPLAEEEEEEREQERQLRMEGSNHLAMENSDTGTKLVPSRGNIEGEEDMVFFL